MEENSSFLKHSVGNIVDYLSWRGDLDFSVSPFNEIDNLILSFLVYVDFEEIIPWDSWISLEEVCTVFFERHTAARILERVSSTKMSAFLMQEMIRTKRFAGIRLSRYINDISMDEESQFCVMLVDTGDDRVNVVYSGTDATIVGWKENFNMSFLEETPGQKKAVDYLNSVAKLEKRMLRLMGHSKGGNLSVFAATHCDDCIADRIEVVYSNDGPGFPQEVLEEVGFRKMMPKIHCIVPDSSIVGMLLYHEEEYEIIKSNSEGAKQHDMLSWEVEGTHLVKAEHLQDKSVLLDRTLKAWVFGMEPTQREEFVNTLFQILEQADIKTVDDLAGNMKPKKIMELLRKTTKLDKQSQEILKDTLQRLMANSGIALKDIVKKAKE